MKSLLALWAGPFPVVDDPFRRRVYVGVFTAAAVYNLVFGAWAVLFPQALFTWLQLPAPVYPVLWSCLGMVVGVYGLLYLHAAQRLDSAFPIIAVGLLGKLAGPLGLAISVARGDLPPRFVTLLVFNDLVWWLPFGVFLLEGTRLGVWIRAAGPRASALLHGLAMVALLGLVGGSEAEPDVSKRAQYLVDHRLVWACCWAVWSAAAVSLCGFYAWWAARVPGGWRADVALVLVGVGLCCDLFGESLYVAWLPDAAVAWLTAAGQGSQSLLALQQVGTNATALLANGFYTASGILLTLATPSMPRWLLVAAWVMWVAGIVMSVSALVGSVAGLVVSSALLFPILVVFCVMLERVLT